MDDDRDIKISKPRFEALVDGIFAFAMTLLVTGLVIPHLSSKEAEAELVAKISAMQSEFISFLVSFFVLASFWQIHHRQFHYVRLINSGVMRITLFILVFVVMMPFTTNVSGDYPHLQLAVGLFHLNMFCLGLLFLIKWRYIARNPDITAVEISGQDVSGGMMRSLIIPFISTLGFIFSFLTPSWSMTTYLLIIPCVAIVKRYKFSGN